MGLLALANFFYEGTQFGDCQVDTKNEMLLTCSLTFSHRETY